MYTLKYFAFRNQAPAICLWLALTACIFIVEGCRQNEEKRIPKAGTSAPARLFTHQVVRNGKTYGYEVHFDGKPIIKQKSIPGKPGNDGFKDSSQAEKVARLVEYKMEAGVMPPTVSKKELDSLGVASN